MHIDIVEERRGSAAGAVGQVTQDKRGAAGDSRAARGEVDDLVPADRPPRQAELYCVSRA